MEKKWPESMPGAWSASEYLTHLRAAIPRSVGDDLRLACDEWTLGPSKADPIEPLRNRGRSALAWPSPIWNSLSYDLVSELCRWMEEPTPTAPGVTLPHAGPDLAGYIGCVHLELCAREDPALGTRHEAVVLPLLISARQGREPTAFVRYLLGWIPRAAPGDWNHPDMIFHAAPAVSLHGQKENDTATGASLCREAIDESVKSGPGFRAHVTSSSQRARWKELAATAPADMREWALGIMY